MTSALTDGTVEGLRAIVGRPGAPRRSPELDHGVLRLLADPLRARIVELLAVEQLCTCHLVELTGARQTNISNHLRVLREAGLVTSTPHGRFTYYQLVPDALVHIADQVTALAAGARQTLGRRRPCP